METNQIKTDIKSKATEKTKAQQYAKYYLQAEKELDERSLKIKRKKRMWGWIIAFCLLLGIAGFSAAVYSRVSNYTIMYIIIELWSPWIIVGLVFFVMSAIIDDLYLKPLPTYHYELCDKADILIKQDLADIKKQQEDSSKSLQQKLEILPIFEEDAAEKER